jgi:hypothetical protein
MFADKTCVIHPSRSALSFCHSCKGFFCENCLIEAGDYYFCGATACVAASQREATRKQAAIRDAYAQTFCKRCIETTEDTAGGKLFLIMNGFGARLLGKRKRCPDCNSVEASAWLCVFFIPIFRIGRYRVVWLGDDSLVTRRLKTV